MKITSKKSTSVRKAPTQDRAKSMVNNITMAAKSLLIEDGLESLTTNRIAQKASISVGSLYQYFPNKQAILVGLYQYWLDSIIIELTTITSFDENKRDYILTNLESIIGQYYAESTNCTDEMKFELELGKAMQLYEELRDIDSKHSIKVAQILAATMRKLGSHKADEELVQVGHYIYCLQKTFDTANSSELISKSVLAKCHVKVIASIIIEQM